MCLTYKELFCVGSTKHFDVFIFPELIDRQIVEKNFTFNERHTVGYPETRLPMLCLKYICEYL